MASIKHKNQNSNLPIFVCFDTNVIINLLILHNIENGTMKNVPEKFNRKAFGKVLDLLKKEQINIIILPVVLKEMQKVTKQLKKKYKKFSSFGYENFFEEFKSNLYTINFTPSKREQYIKESLWLANMYSRNQRVRDKKGKVKEISPIFHEHYGKPSGDARVMAQATVLSSLFVDLYVVTGDGDFFNGGNDRLIYSLNQNLIGCGSMPIEFGKFCEKFERISKFYEKQWTDDPIPDFLISYDDASTLTENFCYAY